MRTLATILLLALTATTVGSQEAPLTITRADPSGELTRLDDANQIRITFSEPMVPLGVVPDGRAPTWLHMQPTWPGAFYWAGRKTLVFSPDAHKPLPSSTRFSIRIDTTATSAAGRRLAAPFDMSFTTPALRLNHVSSRRKTERFDSPVLLDLYFNQPVRDEDLLAHLRVSLEPHGWKRPVLSQTDRTDWQQIDPTGLAQFDRKVTEVDRVTSSSDPLTVRLVVDRQLWGSRYDDSPGRVVVETVSNPPPEAWLRIQIDEAMPVPEGTAPHPPLSQTVKLEPALFLAHRGGDGSLPRRNIDSLFFTGPVLPDAVDRALRIAAVTSPQGPVLIANDTTVRSGYSGDAGQIIYLAMQPAMSRWQIRVSDLQARDGQTLGYSWAGLSERGHDPADLVPGGSVFEAGSGSHLPFVSLNIASFRRWLLPVTPLSLIPTLGRITERDYGGSHYGTYAEPPGAGDETLLTAVTPDLPQRHPVDIRPLLTNGTGWFWATARQPAAIGGTAVAARVPFLSPGSFSAVVQVTNLGITVKDGPLSTLVFVTRLDTGAPVENAVVTIRDGSNDAKWTGRTNPDGVASIPALPLPFDYMRRFVVTAEKNGDAAFVVSTWNTGGQAGNQSLRRSYQYLRDRILRGTVLTDRGAYRAGDRVHIKSVLRDDTRTGMALLAPGTPLQLVVTGPQYAEAVKQTVTVNEWSSVEWNWPIPADAALGRYQIELSREVPWSGGSVESITGTFIVAAYKTPEFQVNATLSSDSGTLGAPLRTRVEARYLFGGGVGARPVNWSVRRFPSSPPDEVLAAYPRGKYDVGYMPDYRSYDWNGDFRSGQTTLNADGNVEVTIPTPEGDVAFQYAFEANVAAASGQHVAGRASMVVHPASIFVAVARPPSFTGSGDGTTVAVAAIDHSGRSVPGVQVDLTLLRTDWTYGSMWTKTETPSGSWTVTTSTSDVPLRLTFQRTGSYVLRAVAQDSAGRTTRTESHFYGLGVGRPMWRSEGNRIELVPERASWKPGESARILIQSPWERATALLTVEREGIRRHQTFTITSMQDVIDVPITEADIPNVFVSVVLVKGRTGEPRSADGSDPGRPAYRVGHVELNVDSARKRLRVGVSADRQEYLPGRPATVGVNVTDADGRPASSEVTFWAVDEGVLSLTGYTLPDVVANIYQPKGLEVMTADNRERLLMTLESGSGPHPFPVVPRMSSPSVVDVTNASHSVIFERLAGFGRDATRKDFRPLVFWLGSMSTGSDGQGRTTVQLPDSLTAYRIMAVAADRESRFGSGELKIRAAKPLALLPVVPRFLSVGDRAALGATVIYQGRTAVDATVTIESSDDRVIQLETPAVRVIRLDSARPTPVSFDAVARDTGPARIRMTIKAGQESDAFEVRLPVTATLRPQVTAAYGAVSNHAAEEKVVVPAGVHAGRGALTVELASTALVGLGEGARYVASYPHESAEVRASRALVYLLSSKLDGAYRLSATVSPQDYRAAAEADLKALAGYECADGYLALFPGQCRNSGSYVGAYVLHVLNVARRLGVDVDPLRHRSVELLTNELTRRDSRTNDAYDYPFGRFVNRGAVAAFIAKVLVEAGEKVDIERVPALADIETLPVFAWSYLADAYHGQGDRGPEYQKLLLRITNALRVSGDGLHVDESDEAGLRWMWLDNVGSTAIVLEGLSRRGDAPDLVVPLVRWLMNERRNGHWSHTHANARTLEALVAYHSAFEAEAPQMTVTTAIGGTRLGRTTFKEQSTRAREVVVPMRELLEQLGTTLSPSLTISRDGRGTVHYTARLAAYLPEDPAPVDRGFAVERSYERVTSEGTGTAATTFAAGDVIRVRVRITLRSDGQYLALTDPLPAGFEALDEHFETTQRDHGEGRFASWWNNYEFDHVEKHDDRVLAYATRMEPGTHELTYLVRAVTSGTFSARGATLEAMYAPEWSGLSAAVIVRIR